MARRHERTAQVFYEHPTGLEEAVKTLIAVRRSPHLQRSTFGKRRKGGCTAACRQRSRPSAEAYRGAVLSVKSSQCKRKRAAVGRIKIYQRSQEIIPSTKEGVDRDDRDGGPTKGQHYLPINSCIPGAINPSRFDQFLRDAREELTEHEHEERRGQPRRENERPKAVYHMKHLKKKKHGDHSDLRGQHHRGQHDHKQDGFAAESKSRETESHQAAGNYLADDAASGNYNGIGQRGAKI
jgi:hypothetical protein